MTTILAFLLVLGVLIFVHEAGHFVAAKAVGTASQGSAGLVGPPLKAAATASSSWLQTTLAATCSSGRVLRAMRRSTVCVFAAASANSAIVHQPNIGANSSSVAPTEAAAIVRARVTRMPLSTTRARSISVRQSQVPACRSTVERSAQLPTSFKGTGDRPKQLGAWVFGGDAQRPRGCRF